MDSVLHQTIKQKALRIILPIFLLFFTNSVVLANPNPHKNLIIHPPEIKTIHIQVIDSETKKPIPFTYISLGIGEEVLLQSTFDINGFAEFDVNIHQDWLVHISSIGYISKKIVNYRFTDKEQNVISLEPSAIVLKEFVISQYRNKLIDFCSFHASYSSCGYSSVSEDCFTSISDSLQLTEVDTKPENKPAFNQQLQIVAFPNPTRGLVTITNLIEVETFQLMDLSGKILQVVSVTNRKQEIDLSYYPTGMYFINFLDKGIPKTIKIIKN